MHGDGDDDVAWRSRQQAARTLRSAWPRGLLGAPAQRGAVAAPAAGRSRSVELPAAAPARSAIRKNFRSGSRPGVLL
jgi:hypothetical protein